MDVGNCRDVFLKGERERERERERKLLKRWGDETNRAIKRSRTRILKCAGYYGVWKRINMSNAFIG
jgi:hypothetical protein